MALVIFALGATNAARAQQSREYDLKAAFIYQFTKFVDWPESAFAETNSPIVIGVVGENPFNGALDAVTQGELVNGRRIVVRPINRNERPAGCHLLFIPRAEQGRSQAAQRVDREDPVLTVSDAPNFASRGGMVELYVENNKIRFRVNPQAARDAKLRISSKLLRLGEVVEPNP